MVILGKGIFRLMVRLIICMVPSFGEIEIAGLNGTIKFERLQNDLGQTLVYYDQKVATGLCTSYTVENLMCCRQIPNVSQFATNPQSNVVSVGKVQNGNLSCEVCYQNVSDLQLTPKIGMFTFYSWNHDNFSPASNGIFYQMFGVFMKRWAQNAPKYCNDNLGWKVAYAITTEQQNILLQYMKVTTLDMVHVNANCSTNIWNDENSTPFTNLSSETNSYVKISINGQFQCITNRTNAYVVCMRNIFSTPWNKI